MIRSLSWGYRSYIESVMSFRVYGELKIEYMRGSRVLKRASQWAVLRRFWRCNGLVTESRARRLLREPNRGLGETGWSGRCYCLDATEQASNDLEDVLVLHRLVGSKD